MSDYSEYKKEMESIYSQAEQLYREGKKLDLPEQQTKYTECMLFNSESAKAGLSVILTSLIKKIREPSQDIRKHQVKMKGGYSGRTLDTKVTVPFLKEKNITSMSESGWLTRSYEQALPYDLDYPGEITPKEIKEAFLAIIDGIQTKGWDSSRLLIFLFEGLIRKREEQSSLKLARPTDKTIAWIIEHLTEHFDSKYSKPGASRLPVLAVYAVYQQLLIEVSRYKGKKLAPLKSHNSPDTRAGDVGDIQILENENVFEAVEIKHDIKITAAIVNTSFEKFKSQPIDRYYLLTTKKKDPIANEEVSAEIIKIKKTHGCQVIVNGVESTLKYYLRLLSNTKEYIDYYATLVENDTDLKYEHRIKWNELVTGEGNTSHGIIHEEIGMPSTIDVKKL
jgi:DNA (cytosine-5)-methyltransferase 1